MIRDGSQRRVMANRFFRPVLTFAAVLLLASCSNAVVRMPDSYDGQQIEVGSDQIFEIELGGDRSVSNDPEAYEWVLLDPGVMRLVSAEPGTHPEDEDEFIGGYSRYTLFTFEPATTGIGDLVFGLFPTGELDGDPLRTTAITINATS
jgi:hypothetical protein